MLERGLSGFMWRKGLCGTYARNTDIHPACGLRFVFLPSACCDRGAHNHANSLYVSSLTVLSQLHVPYSYTGVVLSLIK